MTLPNPPYEGSCLCGAVQVRVTAEPLLTLACHCGGCQKFSASAFSLTTMVPSHSFSCTGTLQIGGLGAETRQHFFCASCKNFIYTQIAGAEHRINLRTSVLNDGALFEPFVELMTDRKIPWAQVPAQHSFAQFPTSPEALETLIDDYARHHGLTRPD